MNVSAARFRVLAAAVGGFAGAIIGNIILMCADIWWLHPGNPDAGQLGVVGIWIGLPVGCIITWKLTGDRKRPKN